jgi:hypothetical protein
MKFMKVYRVRLADAFARRNYEWRDKIHTQVLIATSPNSLSTYSDEWEPG